MLFPLQSEKIKLINFHFFLELFFVRCDADPSALARYVLALLKKDKPLRDLRQCMNEQLDVFLNAETQPFLERLFIVIANEEYLNAPIRVDDSSSVTASAAETIPSSQETITSTTSMNASTPAESDSNNSSQPASQTKRIERRKFTTSPRQDGIGATTTVTAADDSDSPLVSSISKLRDVSPISPVKSGEINEHHRRDNRRRSARSRSRSRSRTRRNLDRDKYGSRHSYRNKSPPNDDRRKTNPFRRNSGHEIRSPKYYKRSHSPMDGLMAEERKGTRSLSPSVKNDRCRDFDEKGYCMRGETCPWDHGVNPVVLEDINNPIMTMQTAPHVRSGGEYNPDAPELWSQTNAFANGSNRTANSGPITNAPPNAYARLPVTAANATGFRGPNFPFPVGAAGPGAAAPLQRELISVPVVEANSGGDVSAAANQKRRYEPEDTVAVAEGPAKRKIPINSRLGPISRAPIQNNCSLELRKVPRGLNSIAHLNNHFCKFGKIVNIQVSYEGDPEAAIVTFSTHAEANVAYRSTEAVLNNRFIKVFWHTPGTNAGVDGNHNATAAGQKDDTNAIHPRKGHNQYSLNNTIPANPTPTSTDASKATNSITNAIANTTFNKTTPTTPATVAPVASLTTNRARSNKITRAGPEIVRKLKEEQAKAAVQLAHGLHKRKHELLQGYVKQMRSLIEMVERLDSSDPQRATLLDTIKSLQENIDELKKQISADQAQMAQIQPGTPGSLFKKTKEMQKKELLDCELELIAQQQEGNDTTAIQKRIEELQKCLGIASKTGFPGIRSARVRPPPPGSTSVDRRPTTLLVAGFVSDDCDALLGHFKVNIYLKYKTKNQLITFLFFAILAFRRSHTERN